MTSTSSRQGRSKNNGIIITTLEGVPGKTVMVISAVTYLGLGAIAIILTFQTSSNLE